MPATANRVSLALLTFAILVLGAGCGQSGPLYIPGDPSRIEMPPPADQPAEEDEDSDQAGQ